MKSRSFIKKSTLIVFIFLYTIKLSAQEPDPKKALSLARVKNSENTTHIIHVSSVGDSLVKGIDLSKRFNFYSNDIFEFLEKVSYERISSEVLNTSQEEIKSFKVSEILTPVDIKANTIAAASNYPEHKQETKVRIEPVLFPKITELTSFKSFVNTNSEELLDYEVELAVIYSKDVHNIKDIEDQYLGFMVAIDYSDRASMLRAYDTDHPELAVGFTDSKSKTGFFPVGPIMIVPKDWQTYYSSLKIQLWRNNEQKQNDQLKSMIWDVKKITEEALKLGDTALWTFHGKPVSLLPKNYIEKGTITITGTPGGVLFAPPSQGFIIAHGIKYTLFFKFFNWNPEDYVIDQYIKKQKRKNKFLHDGDHIQAYITNMGNVYSEIKYIEN